MASIAFEVPIPVGDQPLPINVIVELSDTINGIRTEVVNVLYASLIPDPSSGLLHITDAAIDDSKNVWLTFEASSGTASVAYLAPKPPASNIVTLLANILDTGGNLASESFYFDLLNGYFVSGTDIISDRTNLEVPAIDGIITQDVIEGSIVKVIYGRHGIYIEVDTTGLGGTIIDLSTLIKEHIG